MFVLPCPRWQLRWKGREWPKCHVIKMGKLCMKLCILLAIQQACMGKLLHGGGKGIILNGISHYFSNDLSSERYALKEMVPARSPADHQTKYPRCRQAATGVSAKTHGAPFQSFQECLLQKQTHRTEHILRTKESRKWHQQWPTSTGGKIHTIPKNIYFFVKVQNLYRTKPESTSKVWSDSL